MGDNSSPTKWLGFLTAIILSPAYAGLKICCVFDPGAYAPGFMLSPASQAKTCTFVQSQLNHSMEQH